MDPTHNPIHALSAAEVLQAFGTSANGLSSQEVAVRTETYGPNLLPEPARKGLARRFLAHFHNLLVYALLAAAAITASLGHIADTAVILTVVVANAVFGFLQEGRAEQAMAAIRKMLAPRISVLRDGRRKSLDSATVVPGDVVLLEAGERVPADLRLIAARGLRIEEAILTGESVPVDKSADPVARNADLGDRTCMAYSGTLVAAGTGRGVVVATGSATEVGAISALLADVEPLTTPLTRQMDGFARWLTMLILLFSGILLVNGYLVGQMPFSEVFMSVVGLAVAAIPEDLPAVLTVTLAVGVRAMARRNAIVRQLPAIETLGSVSVICTDKTGTLTRNEMVVASVAVAGASYSVSGDGYAPEGAIHDTHSTVDAAKDPQLVELARAAELCNDAALHSHPDGWRVEGDPMEGALRAFAGKILRQDPAVSSGWTRADVIPFDASHRFMAVLCHDAGGDGVVYVKGAPERILGMCRGQRSADRGESPLSPKHWHHETNAIVARGQRVLALAVRRAPAGHMALSTSDLRDELILLGLVGLTDPPRPEAVAAVAECHQAGIRVKMITGDHPGTAAAIGREIGLRNTANVLTGAELTAMSDAELAAAVEQTDIFARTNPEHKLRLVKALQSHGLSVAMTGDGVNDAPALKRADAGIAMGRTGSEAAKEAAVLVLADDNFASIVAAVREGRTVYDNIKKVISWTLPTNAGEAMTIVVALLLGMTLPLTAVQILWVNLITGIVLAAALAFEPTEQDTMRRPPRARHAPLLNGVLVWHILFVSTLFVVAVFGVFAYASRAGHSPELARTLALNTLVVLEVFHLFFIRNIYGTSLTWKAAKGTPAVWICVTFVALGQLAVTYLLPLQRVFGTAAISFAEGVLVLAVGVVFFAVIETEKQIRLALQHR